MRISDWSSDVCSSDLYKQRIRQENFHAFRNCPDVDADIAARRRSRPGDGRDGAGGDAGRGAAPLSRRRLRRADRATARKPDAARSQDQLRAEEHTSELQSLMHISFAVFCLKKTKSKPINEQSPTTTTK